MAKLQKYKKRQASEDAYKRGKKRLAAGIAVVGGAGLTIAGAKALKNRNKSEDSTPETGKKH
jgi:hypothetical protein